MDELFAQYERELVTLRNLCREYADRYPKVAAKLQMGGDSCDDPHVERLIESVALLCARVSKRIDDSYPQFTEALLNLLFPHYLRPFPSCAIVRFTRPPGAVSTECTRFAKGTFLKSGIIRNVECQFHTTYDIALGPIELKAARFSDAIRAPAASRLPPNVTSALAITLTGFTRSSAADGALRIYIDGDPSFCAALRDALFVRAVQAYVEPDCGNWKALDKLPIRVVGFDEDDALIPFDARSHTAYRLLAEYFSFPEKFNFFDIDLAALGAAIPADCFSLTLHLALAGIRPDSDQARMLASLSAQNLVLGCTPVVNLFKKPGVPIAYTQLSADYTVVPDSKHAAAYEVYAVDRVHLIHQGKNVVALDEFRPFYSHQHCDSKTHVVHYWIMRHDETLAVSSPGHEKSIALVSMGSKPHDREQSALSVDLMCTNRDLPCQLKCGAPGGDLFFNIADITEKVRILRRPTRPARFSNDHGSQWRLISHLALNQQSLAEGGADGLREMLSLYDLAQSPVSQRQIAGIIDLEHCPATSWIRHQRGSSLVHGTQIRLTLDEDAFVGSGLHLFVQVIERFFALYVQVNSFVELFIVSQQTGEELFRCQTRTGDMSML